MEEKCMKCDGHAGYICVCIERHLCDKCLLNHVSSSTTFSHRPVSLAHPLLTLFMENDQESETPASNSIQDQIKKLTQFKEKSIKMIEKKIKQLLDQNERNSLRKSINKENETNSMIKPLSEINSRASPALDIRSLENRSPVYKAEESTIEGGFNLILTNSMITQNESCYKIIITGDSGVGKTALLQSFRSMQDSTKQLWSSNKATGCIKVDNNSIFIDLWDLSGKDKYSALSKLCLYKAAGAIFMFDLINETTLWTVDKRISAFAAEADVLSVMALVGNKLDQTVRNPKKRFCSYDKAHSIAREKGMIYDEISATNPQHVAELFRRIVKEIQSRKTTSKVSQSLIVS